MLQRLTCVHVLPARAAPTEYDYLFSENGLVAYKQGKVLAIQSLKKLLGEDKLKELINFILHYIADLDIPIKRGGAAGQHSRACCPLLCPSACCAL